MRLRVIDFGTVSALTSQALYHGMAETVTAESDPLLLLSSPQTPYVCVGMHQEIGREVDEDFCRAAGLPIYRRHVGGGAVYLDRNQLFTHFVYPHGKAPRFARNLYPLFIEPVVRTYRDFGIDAAYRPINDIQVKGRKIGGTGAASIAEATVMVGSFMYDFDTATMARCLRVPSEKFRDKLRKGLDDYMTTMARELDEPPPRDVLVAHFLGHCAEALGVEPTIGEASAAERAAISRAETALSDPEWTHAQGRKLVEMGVKIAAGTHLTESVHKAAGGLVRVHLLGRHGRVADLMISGDFTCLPSEGIDSVAGALKGVALEEEALRTAAEEAIGRFRVEMPGLAPADLAAAIMAAVEQGD